MSRSTSKHTSNKKWGFDITDLDTNIRPQDDFYQYVNAKWMAKNPIPLHESRWGSFLQLRFLVDKQLHALLKELQSKKQIKQHSPEQMIHDFYLSGMDTERRNALGIAPLTHLRQQIAAIKNTDDLTKMIAKLHVLGVGVGWNVFVDQDAKQSDQYILHLVQDGLGMPDRDYYLKNDPESKRVRDAYRKHVSALFHLSGMAKPDIEAATNTLLAFETKLARASMRKEDTRDAEKTYHKVSAAGLRKLAPHINWHGYFSGILVDMPARMVVMQPEFMHAVSQLCSDTPIDTWRLYLDWHVVNEYASLLSAPFVKEQFNFYGHVLSGQQKMRPQWRRVMGTVNGYLGELLGQLYVAKHFGPEAKRKMQELVDNLFVAYEARLENLDWMSTATKRKAVEKLRAMTHKIGYPEKWKSHRGLIIAPDDYVGNVMRAEQFWHKYEMKKLGKPVDYTEWFMYPQTVNAYFNPVMNEIVFPAAILQAPFFSIDFDEAVNYGAIGAVIGHEITHGFDDQGAKFDKKGNMKNWWNEADRTSFEKRTAVLRKQFDQYTVADGVKVNGQLTLGENVADLGGASIAYDAYQLHLEKTERKTLQGFSPEQRFFLAFALFERENVRPEFEKMQVLTDPHSPGHLRINGPASNLPEFYEAFNVQLGDKLYRPPKSRAQIW